MSLRRPVRTVLISAASTLALLTASGLPHLAHAEAPAAAAQTPAPSAKPWAHEASDLAPDSRLRFGRMSNGMRYVIMRNATPPSLAAIRLHINAGSLNETDDQKGLAHFTEHMLFNGTENIPENEMLRILERLGLAFGADTNAGTSFDQTYYTLNLPRADEEVVSTSMRILREQMSRALMRTEDIDAERDVVVGEARSRDTPGFRNLKAQLALLAPNQKVGDRMPIGDLDVIRTAPAQRFIDFYRAYYRPERATMIVVGDFDPDFMEGQIRTAFEDWTNTHPDGAERDLGKPEPRGTTASVLVEPGVDSSVSLYWIKDYEEKPDNRANRREATLRNLGFAVLNRRLGEMSRQDDPPFRGASGGASDFLKSFEATSLSASFNPGGLPRALQTLEQEKRRLVEFGVSQVELDREIANIRTALQNAVQAADTQQTGALAAGLLNHVNGDSIPTSPADDLALFEEVVASLDVAEINRLLTETLQGYGPLALVSTPVPIEGGEAGVVKVLEDSQRVPVTAREVAARQEWTYTDFGTPTAPVTTGQFNQVQATYYTFPNNVRLIVKPTDFTQNQILISLATGVGDLGLPKDSYSPLNIASNVFTAGGVGKLSADELSNVLTGRTYSVGFGVGEDQISMSGATRPQDLELQLQVMAAYFTDPALRPAPLERLKAAYPQILEQSRATVGGALSLEVPVILSQNDRRAGLPTVEEVQSFTADRIKADVVDALSAGPIDITIVGDVKPEDAIAVVGKTFGALPTRSALPQPAAGSDQRALPAPRAEPYRITHNGLPEQAGAAVYFKGTDNFGDRREARRVALMSEVLSLRVLEEIREKQALTYSPSVGSTSSSTYRDYGYIGIVAEVDTARVADFYAAVDKVIDSFAENPVTDDELARARTPMLERHRRSQANNAFWLGNLNNLHRKPKSEELIANFIPTIESFTAADIQDAARTYLQKDKTIRIDVLPAAR